MPFPFFSSRASNNEWENFLSVLSTHQHYRLPLIKNERQGIESDQMKQAREHRWPDVSTSAGGHVYEWINEMPTVFRVLPSETTVKRNGLQILTFRRRPAGGWWCDGGAGGWEVVGGRGEVSKRGRGRSKTCFVCVCVLMCVRTNTCSCLVCAQVHVGCYMFMHHFSFVIM